MGKARTYDGKDIAISFDMSRCIHARNCYLKLPQVFDPPRRPWVDPDAAPAEDIAAMIRTCPSGALTYARRDGGRIYFDADSDALIVRGLIAVLHALYAGVPVNEIDAIDAQAELGRLGLDEHLSSQRSNGLRAMVARIRQLSAAAA